MNHRLVKENVATLPGVPDDDLDGLSDHLDSHNDPGDDLADLDDPGDDLADHDDLGKDLDNLNEALERTTPPIRLSPVGAAAYCPFCKGTI